MSSFAVKNRRSRRIWRTAAAVLIAVVVIYLLLIAVSIIAFDKFRDDPARQVTDYVEVMPKRRNSTKVLSHCEAAPFDAIISPEVASRMRLAATASTVLRCFFSFCRLRAEWHELLCCWALIPHDDRNVGFAGEKGCKFAAFFPLFAPSVPSMFLGSPSTNRSDSACDGLPYYLICQSVCVPLVHSPRLADKNVHRIRNGKPRASVAVQYPLSPFFTPQSKA